MGLVAARSTPPCRWPRTSAAFWARPAIVMALIARQRTGLRPARRGAAVRRDVHADRPLRRLRGRAGACIRRAASTAAAPAAFRCSDGKYVQFDTSSARHLTWFAHEAGIDDWEPELLDIVKLRDADAQPARCTPGCESSSSRSTAAEWEAHRQRGRRRDRLVPQRARSGSTRSTRAGIGAVAQLDDPELGPTWMAGLPVKLSATPGAARRRRVICRTPTARGILAELDTLATSRRAAAAEPGLAHPLQGMKVLDLCVALAGPTCGRLLLRVRRGGDQDQRAEGRRGRLPQPRQATRCCSTSSRSRRSRCSGSWSRTPT